MVRGGIAFRKDSGRRPDSGRIPYDNDAPKAPPKRIETLVSAGQPMTTPLTCPCHPRLDIPIR